MEDVGDGVRDDDDDDDSGGWWEYSRGSFISSINVHLSKLELMIAL